MEKLMAPCGIDCAACEAYIATQNNDLEVMKKHQKHMLDEFNKEVSLEDLRCDGCQSTGKKIGFCQICGIRLCAIEKGYATCAECAELPCEKGKFIWKEGSKSLQSLFDLR